jgi:hypothetical protein
MLISRENVIGVDLDEGSRHMETVEIPETPLLSSRLGKITLRDVIVMGSLVLTMANYQFGVKAQVERNTEKIEQVDAHLANTDKILREEVIPRPVQERTDANFAAQLAALQQQFVQSLLGRR